MSLVVAVSENRSPEECARELRASVGSLEPSLVVFFASPVFDAERLGAALAKEFGNVPSVGCSTAGEITTGRMLKNSVVLMAQIHDYEEEGKDRWNAIVEATVHRLRPILLTAAAAILGLIPIAGEVFWGPMAFAMMGGLLIATVLTLIFLPALYATWYRVREPDATAAG